jgi:hypothetical protein
VTVEEGGDLEELVTGFQEIGLDDLIWRQHGDTGGGRGVAGVGRPEDLRYIIASQPGRHGSATVVFGRLKQRSETATPSLTPAHAP